MEKSVRYKNISLIVPVILGAALLTGCNAGSILMPESGGKAIESNNDREAATVVARAECQPNDLPDTGLQGQVPIEDRLSGRAEQGYRCNLERIGGHEGQAFASFDAYGDCLYMPNQTWPDSGIQLGHIGFGTGIGIRVFDMSNSREPVQTDLLTSPIALAPDESMTVNHQRGLLVMNSTGDSQIDIYDLKPDCRHPKLIGTFDMAPATGHAGWFSPDGMIYWMTSALIPKTKNIFPIDISDPKNPVLLAEWETEKLGTTFGHNGWTSDDGKIAFACQAALLSGEDNKILVFRVPEPGELGGPTDEHLINSFHLEGIACQDIKAVTYDGKPHLIANSEYAQGRLPFHKGPTLCSSMTGKTVYGAPVIYDIDNILNPVVISHLMLEVDAPENCEATVMDQDLTTETSFPGEIYDTHFCRPDRLKNPTILACVRFLGGLEVYDIRDPYNVKEIAYYRPGTLGIKALQNPLWRATPLSMENCFAPPVVVASRGEIWFGCYFSGLNVVKFPESVYPFPESLTCNDDYYFDQYNPGFCKK